MEGICRDSEKSVQVLQQKQNFLKAAPLFKLKITVKDFDSSELHLSVF